MDAPLLTAAPPTRTPIPELATIVPLLLMPPAKVEILMDAPVTVATPPTAMALPPALIVPELVMPPETAALLVTRIPLLFDVACVVIWPALIIAPPIVLLLMVMPVRVGAVAPIAVMMPLLLLMTSPATLVF